MCLVVSGVIGHLTIQRFADHALGVNALFFLPSLTNLSLELQVVREEFYFSYTQKSPSDLINSVHRSLAHKGFS